MMLENDNEAEGEQNKRNKSNQSLSLAVVGSSKFKSKSGLSMTHPLPPSATNLTRSSLHHSHALGFLHVFTSLAHVNVSWVLHPSLCINIYILFNFCTSCLWMLCTLDLDLCFLSKHQSSSDYYYINKIHFNLSCHSCNLVFRLNFW